MPPTGAGSVAPPAPRRRTRRSERTRERILEAAVEVFARRGFHGARVADIAEQAGIAYGLVYHHFRNKDDILAAIFTERWGRYLAYIDSVARTAPTFRECLGRLVHFWIQTYLTEPHLMTVMINEISRSYEFLDSHDVGPVLVAFDAVERLVEAGRESGELRAEVDPAVATYAILGAMEMILTGYVMGTLRRGGKDTPPAADEEQIVGLLYGGLVAR